MKYFPILLVLISCHNLSAQAYDFGENCKEIGSENCPWEKSWGSEDCCTLVKEGHTAYLQIQGQKENAVGFVEQSLAYAGEELAILELSARVKTKAVIGRGAGLNLGLYDEDGQLISSKDMGGLFSTRWVKGTTDWLSLSIRTVVPPATKTIKIGAILYGSGQSYFDQVRLSRSSLADRKPSALGVKYISEAIAIIREHSLYRDSFNLKEMQLVAERVAGSAEKPEDCYVSIQYLLESLRPYGDNHSFFMGAKDTDFWRENDEADGSIDYPEVHRDKDIAYIYVPPFYSGNPDLIISYADSLQRGLKRVYDNELKGWIVDLRQNTGGNMEPMILGLGPLLKEDTLGSLVDVNGQSEYWYYRSGAYLWEKDTLSFLKAPFIISDTLPIVVLLGPSTGSSGEIVAISFIGNPNTVTVGKSTWGLTTGNGDFSLSDGAQIFLASTKMVDRHGKIYTASIKQDILLDAPNFKEDVVLQFARDWIKRQ